MSNPDRTSKSASITVRLVADSGYESDLTGRVSAEQWFAIDGIIGGVAPALADDVVDLIIAAREVMDVGHQGEEFMALDKALEAFSGRVPYENEPDDEALAARQNRAGETT